MRGILIRSFTEEYQKTNSLQEKANILKEIAVLSKEIIEDLYKFWNKNYKQLTARNYDGIITYLIHDSRRYLGQILFFIKELEVYGEKSQVEGGLRVAINLLPFARMAFILLELLQKEYGENK